MKLKKHFSGFLVLVVAVAVVIFQLSFNLGVERSAPSDKWAKEVKIGAGLSDNKPVMRVEDDRIITVYQKDCGAGITVTGLHGNDTKEYDINIEASFIKGLAFYKDTDNYHIIYVTSENGVYFGEDIVLDSGFNEVRREKQEGVFSVRQTGNVVVTAMSSSITVIDGDNNAISTFNTDEINMIDVSKSGDKIVIAYMSKDKCIKTGIVDDGKIDFRTTYEAADISTLNYSNLVLSCDESRQYIMFDESAKGEKLDTRYIEASIDSESCLSGKLAVDGDDGLSCITAVPSKDGGKFYATSDRVFGTKEIRRTLIEFSFKDGQAYDVSNVSRVRGTSVYGCEADGYIAYLSSGDEVYNVNLSSTQDSFKNINNTNRSTEVTDAVLDTLQGFIMSIAYILVIGFRWIVPMLVIAGIVTFLDYKFNEKKKLRAYAVSAAVNAALKTKVIYDIVYMTYGTMMPDIIAAPIAGIIICIAVSAVVFASGYIRYKKDSEVLFMGMYGIYMLIDALITCMVFVPFFA